MAENDYFQVYTDQLTRLKNFADQIGYPIADFIYFRKLGPIMNACFKPGRGCEIYVSGLPRDAIEDEIFDFFSNCGKIYDLKLMLTELGVYNRGYAFIRFCEPEEAKRAVTFYDKSLFRSFYQLSVQKLMENRRLYMCGLPFSKTKIEIWNELIAHGINGVTDVFVYKSRRNAMNNRGFVFVEFENQEMASKVRFKYNRNMVLFLFGKPILVDWAISTTEADPDVMGKVKRLFLRNLSVTLSRMRFVTMLSQVINMEDVEKVYKAKDYAFVHFCDRDAAERALNKLKHYFKGTDIEVTWSIPPEEVKKVGKARMEQHKVLQNLYTHKDTPSLLWSSFSDDNNGNAQSPECSTTSSPHNRSEKDFKFPSWWDLLEMIPLTISKCPLRSPELDSDGHGSNDSLRSITF